MSNYLVAIDKDGNYILAHAGKWRQHKYIRKEGNRYIYPEDLRRGKATDAVARGAGSDGTNGPNKISKGWSGYEGRYQTRRKARDSRDYSKHSKKYTAVQTVHNTESSALRIARAAQTDGARKSAMREIRAREDQRFRGDGLPSNAQHAKTWVFPHLGTDRVLTKSIRDKQVLSASSKGKSIVDSIKSFGSSVAKAASSAVAKGKSILDSIFKRPTATSAMKKGLRK